MPLIGTTQYHMGHFPESLYLSGKCKELCLLRRRCMRGLGQGWFQDSKECQLCRRAAGRGGRIDLRAPEQVLPSWPWPCSACPAAWRGGRQPPPLPSLHTRSGNSRSHCLSLYSQRSVCSFQCFPIHSNISTSSDRRFERPDFPSPPSLDLFRVLTAMQ